MWTKFRWNTFVHRPETVVWCSHSTKTPGKFTSTFRLASTAVNSKAQAESDNNRQTIMINILIIYLIHHIIPSQLSNSSSISISSRSSDIIHSIISNTEVCYPNSPTRWGSKNIVNRVVSHYMNLSTYQSNSASWVKSIHSHTINTRVKFVSYRNLFHIGISNDS